MPTLAVMYTIRAVDRRRRDQRLLNARDGRIDGGRVGAIVEQHAELIAADAAHDVGRAHRALQAVGDDAQHRIAREMSERVVDLFEVVEIEEQHGTRAIGCVARVHERELQLLLKERPVGETRERVVRGFVTQPGLRARLRQRRAPSG